MPHYRTMMLNPDYLSAADLWDEKEERYREVIVQIDRVAQGHVIGEQGRKKEMPFAHFAGKKKPLGLNATNCLTLKTITGSPNTERWLGTWIALFVIPTFVGGEERDAIRIRPKAAAPANDNKKAPANDNKGAP